MIIFDLTNPEHTKALEQICYNALERFMGDGKLILQAPVIEDETWTSLDVQKHFKVKRHQIYNYIKQGLQTCGGNPLKFSKLEVLKWEQENLSKLRKIKSHE